MKSVSEAGLSAIVPVANGETQWRKLLLQLIALPVVNEIIFSASEQQPEAFQELFSEGKKILWICSRVGRATQQNQAADAASQKWLWFLHADSVLMSDTQAAVNRVLSSGGTGIYYFDLKFVTDEFKFMRLNEVGAWFRSRILKIPFGDQGLLMKAETFHKIGRFNEETKYGEDHLLIWKAHQSGHEVSPVGFSLGTSARKYKINGWLRTTALHIWLTAKQASPQFLQTLRERHQRERK